MAMNISAPEANDIIFEYGTRVVVVNAIRNIENIIKKLENILSTLRFI